MHHFAKAARGVTLLEIMLVLAIAAMIIVMSTRYYQSATTSSQANSIMMQIQAIVSAADQLAQATGSYNNVITTGAISAVLGPNSTTTVWGTAITITAQNASKYLVKIALMPASVCYLIKTELAANSHFINMTNCDTTSAADFSYEYSST